MHRFALLLLLLTILPGCGFMKGLGLGLAAVGGLGAIGGGIGLAETAKNAPIVKDPEATKNGYRVSGGILGGGIGVALVGAGLYLMAESVEKDLQRAAEHREQEASSNDSGK
ncbi:MAG: hypothetical protein QM820_60355 [Minicystis sp.]